MAHSNGLARVAQKAASGSLTDAPFWWRGCAGSATYASSVQREIERLRRMAQLVESDLRATLGGYWQCEVGSDYVLVVRSEHGIVQLQVDEEVDEENWPEEAWSPRYRDTTIEDDANEAIAESVQYGLETWNLRWPICRLHYALLSPCGGVWACSSAVAHDPAEVGALQAQDATMARVGRNTETAG